VQQRTKTLIRVQAIASGLVQGVNYRWFVVEHAKELELHGWVRNLADGCVEAEIEGAKEDVEKLVEAMKQGPGSAHVTGVATVDLPFENSYHDFQVRYR
jgi:acylphosphatase